MSTASPQNLLPLRRKVPVAAFTGAGSKRLARCSRKFQRRAGLLPPTTNDEDRGPGRCVTYPEPLCDALAGRLVRAGFVALCRFAQPPLRCEKKHVWTAYGGDLLVMRCGMAGFPC